VKLTVTISSSVWFKHSSSQIHSKFSAYAVQCSSGFDIQEDLAEFCYYITWMYPPRYTYFQGSHEVLTKNVGTGLQLHLATTNVHCHAQYQVTGSTSFSRIPVPLIVTPAMQGLLEGQKWKCSLKSLRSRFDKDFLNKRIWKKAKFFHWLLVTGLCRG
jgi:hypothetical protein